MLRALRQHDLGSSQSQEEITPRKAVALVLSVQLGLNGSVCGTAASGLLMIFKAMFLCQPKPWRRYASIIQPGTATACLSVLLPLHALPSKLQRVLWAKPFLATCRNTFGSRLVCFQAFCHWFVFSQPARAKSSPANPRELQQGMSLAKDVSITKLSKLISSDQTDLKSQRTQFMNCWMLDLTANKHQRQESLAGDEKSCPVMRGYEPFLSVWASQRGA